ncbi:TPA: hypothetical protein ACHKIN_004606 [Escherichia coli]|nr:hypothetical protein [Escherichia coli]EED1440645.1 hypothetical protein [Escherichia coli]EIT1009233.1 hypothetical protein [Escherichia coli]EKE3412047.1 hypothetical protein [Escherichia coli]
MQNARHPKTHREQCELACRFLRNNGFKVVFSDRFHAWTSCGEHPDALGFRNGASCLIEVKCSRSDFLADRKKVFRSEPEKGMGDWRFYLCEPGVITVADLPAGWGLLYAINGRVRKVHGWPGNHQWVVTVAKPFRANKQAECDYLFSALRRLEIRGVTENGADADRVQICGL